jgi:hypothetical protein
LKVQLKGRLTFEAKYEGKNVHVAFRSEEGDGYDSLSRDFQDESSDHAAEVGLILPGGLPGVLPGGNPQLRELA